MLQVSDILTKVNLLVSGEDKVQASTVRPQKYALLQRAWNP